MKDSIVVYFAGSNPNSTVKKIADNIASLTGSDIFEIKCENPYSTDFNESVQQALNDLKENKRPVLLGQLPDLDDYTAIILGFPNWCGTAPMPVFSFFDYYHGEDKLVHKEIIPFVVSDGSGFQKSLIDLQNEYPEIVINDKAEFEAGDIDDSALLAIDWIENLR